MESTSFKQSKSFTFLFKKITTIVYASVLQFCFAVMICLILKRFQFSYGSERSFLVNIGGLCLNVAMIVIIAYGLRQIAEITPLPYRRTKAFDPERVKEVKGNVLTSFTLMMFFGADIKTYITKMFPY